MKPADRRFVAYWQDQRKGSKVGYYAIYTLGWGALIFLSLFFLSKLLTNLWKTGGPYLALVFVAIALILAFLITHFTWKANERRLHKLTDRAPEQLN